MLWFVYYLCMGLVCVSYDLAWFGVVVVLFWYGVGMVLVLLWYGVGMALV